MRKILLILYYAAIAALFVIVTLCVNEVFSIKTKLKHSLISDCSSSKFAGGEYFSQYYEDYILESVFAGVKDGFYIDIGTNDPNQDNATKLFYDMGWRGINVEPQNEFYNMLLKSRPLDINVNAALSDKSGVMTLYIPNSAKGSSSLESKALDTFKDIEKTQVDIMTLNDLLAVQNISKIDFLKIDVEGHEHKILQGVDLKKYRPKIIVVEVVSPIDFHGYLTSEPILLANGYELGMSDELNRYYYAQEYPEFAKAFSKINKCVVSDKLKRDALCPNKSNCHF